jgi:two-component system, LuxR family, sensor kinase FixL
VQWIDAFKSGSNHATNFGPAAVLLAATLNHRVQGMMPAIRPEDREAVADQTTAEQRFWAELEPSRLAAIVASSDDAIVSKTLDGKITSWNAGARNIFGYDADEMMGEPIIRIIPPELHDEELQILARLRRGERLQHFETVRIAKDGRRIDVSLTVSPLVDKSGRVVGASKVARDITESKLAERALREGAARLLALIETAVDGVILINAHGVVQIFNPACEQLFGYSAEEVIGENIKILMPEPYRHEHDRYIANYRNTRRPKIIGIGREVIGRRKDGSTFPMKLSVGEAKQDGESAFVGIIHDLTSRNRTEAELQQALEQLVRVARVTTLGELTAAIAHEVNQPLTALVNSGNACLRWLDGETPDVEAARRSVERMIMAGQRAAEVITRIRALVGKSPPRRDRLDINKIATEVIALIQSEIGRSRIALKTELSSDTPFVKGDRIQLQQVILNLMLNAIEAMSGGDPLQRRELLIASMKDGSDGVFVKVQDSGPGLDETAMDRIFDAFYTTKADGMGMGLAVSRTIIQAHGGRLWAAPNLSQGAVFQFRLPAAGKEAS